jgi:hemolysin activation/secretion protein
MALEHLSRSAQWLGGLCALLVAILLPHVGAWAQPAAPTVRITAASWSGEPRDELAPVIDAPLAAVVGQDLTGGQIAELLSDLSERLRKAGFVVGQVVLMENDLQALRQSGSLNVTVYPGKVGAVRIAGNTSRLNDERLQRTAEKAACPSGVGEACVLTAAQLERMQLGVVDVPGVRLEPLKLSPSGVPVGQTAVELTAAPGAPLFSGNVSADNYGYPVSGRYRFGAGGQLTNLFGFGDVISASGSVTELGTLAGSLGFSAPIGYDGLRLVSSYTHSQYTLASVNTAGSADTGRLGLSYPWTRGLDGNWVVSLDGGYTRSEQTVAGVLAFQPRHLTQINFTVAGNSGERALQLGQSYWTAAAIGTHGWVSQDLQGATDTTGVLGDYNKIRLSFLRKQNLGDDFYVLADLRGQVPDRNLDAYEKLQFGGQGAVRAYRVDEGSFDAGGILTIELRRMFRVGNGHVLAPGIVFDGAFGWFTMNPYPNWQTNLGYSNPNLPNSWGVMGFGPAFDWVTPQGVTFSITWTTRLPGSPDSINHPGATNQFLASLSVRF